MKIGFIGLGIMGKPMAKNLLKAGYTDLMVNNHSQAAVQELQAAGATGATQQEIGAQCDVVITMLPNSPQVKEVMLGENGVAAHMKPGAVFIDCSSINPVQWSFPGLLPDIFESQRSFVQYGSPGQL